MFNRMVTAVLRRLFMAAAAVRGWTPRPAPEPGSVKNILLIGTTGLGDTVIATPSFAAARSAWPDARITALLHRRWADLFRPDPNLDDVVVYPGKFKKIVATIRRLRRLEPDLAVILHGNDPDVVPLARLSGAAYVIGRASSRFAFLMDRTVDLSDPDRPNVEKYLDLLRTVSDRIAPRGEELFIPADRRVWADAWWADHGLAPGETLVALNPGGSHPAKRWPGRYWRELVESMSGYPDIRPAIFGAPAEEDDMRSLTAGIDTPAPIIVARANLAEAAALLSRAHAFVGPDSGLGHMAVALDVPALLIFGPDNPKRTGPFMNRAPARILQADPSVCPDLAACKKKDCPHRRCLEAVTPGQVRAALMDDLLTSDPGRL